MRNLFKAITISLLFVCGISQNCEAYDNNNTHPYINLRAAKESKANSILKNSLGFSNGIESEVNGESIQYWIANGGKKEDEPESRCLRHFHDPLKESKDWNEVGLLSAYKSSIYWAQTSGNRILSGGVPRRC